MSTNVFGGRPNAIVCKTAVSFASAGITSGNTSIIYKVGNPLLSYVPGRSINGITGFELDAGYYMVAISDQDLSAYVVPPTTGGGGGPTLLPHTSLFTGTDGTALPSYIPDAGQAWANVAGTWQISGGRALPLSSTAPSSNWLASSDVGSGNVKMTVIGKTTVIADILQFSARWTSSTDQVLVLVGNTKIQIYNITASVTGAPALVQEAAISPGFTDHTYELTLLGTSYTVKYDGSTVLSGTLPRTNAGTGILMSSAPVSPGNVSFASVTVIAQP